MVCRGEHVCNFKNYTGMKVFKLNAFFRYLKVKSLTVYICKFSVAKLVERRQLSECPTTAQKLR